MGIFRAVTSAIGGSLEIQWKELFVCDALPEEALMVRGFKRIGNRSANDNPYDDAITHGSLILIADGQCAIVVSGWKVIASCMTPGEYTYEDPEHASGLRSVLRETGRRIAFGGDAPAARGMQRVYYLSTRECMGNPFAGAIPLNLRSAGHGGEMLSSLDVRGTFSYRLTDPVPFYKLLAGNVSGAYNRSLLSRQIANEIVKALSPAVSALDRQGLRPSELPDHTEELCEALKNVLSTGWVPDHGLEIVSVAIASFGPADGLGGVQELQYLAARRGDLSDPAPVRSQPASPAPASTAIRDSLTRSSGSSLAAAIRGGPPKSQTWRCACGANQTGGKYCSQCGAPRPM